MRKYKVCYQKESYSPEENIEIEARNKDDAWWKAVYEVLEARGIHPYHTYVYSVTFNNGETKVLRDGAVRYFNFGY